MKSDEMETKWKYEEKEKLLEMYQRKRKNQSLKLWAAHSWPGKAYIANLSAFPRQLCLTSSSTEFLVISISQQLLWKVLSCFTSKANTLWYVTSLYSSFMLEQQIHKLPILCNPSRIWLQNSSFEKSWESFISEFLFSSFCKFLGAQRNRIWSVY